MAATYKDVVNSQIMLCQRVGAEYLAASFSSKLGVSRDVQKGIFPIHGLRHAPEAGTCGWYVWSGDYSESPDFFEPVHVEHVVSGMSPIVRYLGLAPGWRFLIGEDGYEDVWFDPYLLKT